MIRVDSMSDKCDHAEGSELGFCIIALIAITKSIRSLFYLDSLVGILSSSYTFSKIPTQS